MKRKVVPAQKWIISYIWYYDKYFYYDIFIYIYHHCEILWECIAFYICVLPLKIMHLYTSRVYKFTKHILFTCVVRCMKGQRTVNNNSNWLNAFNVFINLILFEACIGKKQYFKSIFSSCHLLSWEVLFLIVCQEFPRMHFTGPQVWLHRKSEFPCLLSARPHL